jgi:hypothetical protein
MARTHPGSSDIGTAVIYAVVLLGLRIDGLHQPSPLQRRLPPRAEGLSWPELLDAELPSDETSAAATCT